MAERTPPDAECGEPGARRAAVRLRRLTGTQEIAAALPRPERRLFRDRLLLTGYSGVHHPEVSESGFCFGECMIAHLIAKRTGPSENLHT